MSLTYEPSSDVLYWRRLRLSAGFAILEDKRTRLKFWSCGKDKAQRLAIMVRRHTFNKVSRSAARHQGETGLSSCESAQWCCGNLTEL